MDRRLRNAEPAGDGGDFRFLQPPADNSQLVRQTLNHNRHVVLEFNQLQVTAQRLGGRAAGDCLFDGWRNGKPGTHMRSPHGMSSRHQGGYSSLDNRDNESIPVTEGWIEFRKAFEQEKSQVLP